LKKASGGGAFASPAEQARRIALPAHRRLHQTIEQIRLVTKQGGIARFPSAELLETITSLLQECWPFLCVAKRGCGQRGEAAILRELKLSRLSAEIGKHWMRASCPFQSARPIAGVQVQLHPCDEIVADLIAEIGVDDGVDIADFI